MPYEEVLEGKRYRRNRKDLIKTQESPGAKPVKPPLSIGKPQRVIKLDQ